MNNSLIFSFIKYMLKACVLLVIAWEFRINKNKTIPGAGAMAQRAGSYILHAGAPDLIPQ